MEKNLSAIVTRVHELTTGHPVLVILLDYWSVWLGGAYATAQGDAYVTTAEQLTHEVDTAIQSVAAQSSSAYVDLRAAFKGPDYAYDETHYLSDDGDHPNAAGHKQIASAAVAVIESTLHL
jgi:lysophospholipase L1-like esterase